MLRWNIWIVAAFVLAGTLSGPGTAVSQEEREAPLSESTEIRSLKAQLHQNPDNLKARERLGQRLAEANTFEEVIKTLDPFSHVISVKGLMLLAESYGQKGDRKNQVRILKLVADKAPKSHWAHYKMGHAHLEAGSNEDAIKSFRKSLELQPRHRDSYESLLYIFKKADNRYETRVIVKDMIRRFGQDARLTSEMCRLYAIDGFLEEAIAGCREAIRKDPKMPDNHVYLANAYRDKKEEKMASNILVKAAQQFRASEFVQYTAGAYYLDQKNYPVAARYLEQAVKADPKQPRSQLAYATALFEMGNYEPAMKSFLEACQGDPKNRPQLMTAISKLRSLGQDRLSRQFEGLSYKCSQ